MFAAANPLNAQRTSYFTRGREKVLSQRAQFRSDQSVPPYLRHVPPHLRYQKEQDTLARILKSRETPLAPPPITGENTHLDEWRLEASEVAKTLALYGHTPADPAEAEAFKAVASYR